MASNADVLTVQNLLNSVMEENLIEDGIQGAKTTDAIVQFQLTHNILPDGKVSASLISSLKTALASGSSVSIFSKIKSFASTNAKPLIIVGSLLIFAGGIWYVNKNILGRKKLA